METFTSEFVYHYDVALPEEAIPILSQFIRPSIINTLQTMKANPALIFIHGAWLYSYRMEYKDYVRIGLY